METLKKLRGRYPMVLLAMAGMISASLEMMTNAGGIFSFPLPVKWGSRPRRSA